MAGINRYKLVYHYFDGKEKNFKVHYEDGTTRDRFMLTEIDALTSKFENDDALAHMLNMINDEYQDGYFLIEYKSNGTLKTMEVVYNDVPLLGKLASDNLRQTKISKENADIYMKNFLRDINKNPDFLEFILSHRYTNDYFKSALSYYLRLKNSDEKEAQNTLWEAEAELKKEFSRYKTVRGIEIGKRNYELFRQKKEVPKERGKLTIIQRAKIEYELNHPEKVKNKKTKKSKALEGQMTLFDPSEYTEPIHNKKR